LGFHAFHTNPHHQDHFIDSYDHLSYSYVFPILCDYCEPSNHDVHNCSYTNYVNATSASLEELINELTYKMIDSMKERIGEYSHCFNQSRNDTNLHKPYPGLGFLEPVVTLYNDFESFIQFRPDLYDDMPLHNPKQEMMSLCLYSSPHTLHLNSAHIRTSLRIS